MAEDTYINPEFNRDKFYVRATLPNATRPLGDRFWVKIQRRNLPDDEVWIFDVGAGPDGSHVASFSDIDRETLEAIRDLCNFALDQDLTAT